MVPNNPDNRMNELLRSYAQKRRAEAEPSFEMPSSARRALQAEVKRRFSGDPVVTGADGESFTLFWRRLLWGGAVTAILFIGAGVWLEMENSRNGKFAELR